MALDEFVDLMPASITVEPYAAQDEYGTESYGAAVTYKAHIQGKTIKKISFSGEERVSNFQCYLNTATAISPRDRVTLPSGYSPQQPPIIAVGRHMDENGAHHVVLFV